MEIRSPYLYIPLTWHYGIQHITLKQLGIMIDFHLRSKDQTIRNWFEDKYSLIIRNQTTSNKQTPFKLMETTKIEYNGFNYLVNHLYTDVFYGRKSVYHVLTNNQKWCGSLIPELCGFPNVDSKGEHDLIYKRNPTMTNALKPYYTVDFKQDDMYEKHFDMKSALDGFEVDTDSYYEFVYKEPYDD